MGNLQSKPMKRGLESSQPLALESGFHSLSIQKGCSSFEFSNSFQPLSLDLTLVKSTDYQHCSDVKPHCTRTNLPIFHSILYCTNLSLSEFVHLSSYTFTTWQRYQKKQMWSKMLLKRAFHKSQIKLLLGAPERYPHPPQVIL